MNKLSKYATAVVSAYHNGYRIKDGQLIYKGKKVPGWKKHGYMYFSVRMNNSYSCPVPFHRLVAYQKYGECVFLKGIVCRHVDGNKLNNHQDNIVIGTQKDNILDIPSDKRFSMACHASSFIKKHDHEKVLKMHNSGIAYSKIMKECGITSKGTVSFIINKSICNKKGA